MSNVGSKISCGGLLICALTAGIRILTYFGAIIFGDEVIADTNIYLNYGFLLGLAITFIGYILKFIGERDFFDLIAAATVFVSIVISFVPVPVFYGSLISDIMGSALSELFLLGIGICLFKKGKQTPGIVLSLMFIYFVLLYPAFMYLIFGGGAGGVIRYLINIFNGTLSVVTLGLAAVSVANDD